MFACPRAVTAKSYVLSKSDGMRRKLISVATPPQFARQVSTR
jgi:hypothetical protein